MVGLPIPYNTRQQTNFSIHVNKHFSSYNALGSTELLETLSIDDEDVNENVRKQ